MLILAHDTDTQSSVEEVAADRTASIARYLGPLHRSLERLAAETGDEHMRIAEDHLRLALAALRRASMTNRRDLSQGEQAAPSQTAACGRDDAADRGGRT